jgi:ADP-ribose pyrophosphatase
MEYKLRRLDRQLASDGKVLSFYRDTMELPDGKIEQWDYVHHKRGGGACVVPVLNDGRILMVHQYRPALDRESIELPAGAFDADDPDFAVTASRELEEETGYKCGKIRRLVRLDTAIAWCDEKVEVYLAEDLYKAGGQQLDDAEEIGLEAIPVEELRRRIFAGEMRDAKTVAGILAYLAVLSGAQTAPHT